MVMEKGWTQRSMELKKGSRNNPKQAWSIDYSQTYKVN